MGHWHPSGMRAFALIWVGQVFSLTGTTMSTFALTLWAWGETGTATSLSLVAFFSFVPMVLIAPLAGALVDRWNRRLTMAISDTGSGVMTLIVVLLYLTGRLEVWHLFITGTFTSIFQAFQWPAYSSTISVLVPKEHYARASGMMSIAESGSAILAPILAGALYGRIGLPGILAIDVCTLMLALLTLFQVEIPTIPRLGASKGTSLIKDSLFGIEYILKNKSLFYLQLVFFFGNFVSTIGSTLINPMVLSRTANNEKILATVQSIGAFGGIASALLITVWGGPQRKVNGVLLGWALSGLLGLFVIGVGKTPLVWIIGAFFTSFFNIFIGSSNQAIWQAKVPPALQGRVFAIRMIVAQLATPLALLATGPLADQIFEPALQDTESLASRLLIDVFGASPGSGMAFLIALNGLLTACIGFLGYAFSSVRDVEKRIPDHDLVEGSYE
ncbi:MAG TPA: MFS transporter [Spirochaetia bacterium]|nr:MFS transporter [Spirochaetia bacterium]